MFLGSRIYIGNVLRSFDVWMCAFWISCCCASFFYHIWVHLHYYRIHWCCVAVAVVSSLSHFLDASSHSHAHLHLFRLIWFHVCHFVIIRHPHRFEFLADFLPFYNVIIFLEKAIFAENNESFLKWESLFNALFYNRIAIVAHSRDRFGLFAGKTQRSGWSLADLINSDLKQRKQCTNNKCLLHLECSFRMRFESFIFKIYLCSCSYDCNLRLFKCAHVRVHAIGVAKCVLGFSTITVFCFWHAYFCWSVGFYFLVIIGCPLY